MAPAKEAARPSHDNKPLSGRRIVITRARAQAVAFVRALEDLGGEIIEFPTIEIIPPISYELLDRAIQNIGNYHWIIFTSVNGVNHFFPRLKYLKRGIKSLSGIKFAAVGPETARALKSAGVHPDLVPGQFRAEAILEELNPGQMAGKRILLPRAAKARDILPQTLREWGADVDAIDAYQTVTAKSDASFLHRRTIKNEIDMITFTSSSAVANFAALVPGKDVGLLLSGTAVACIGPITQKTATELGIRVDVVSQEYSIPGLTKAIVEYFTRTEQ